MFLHLWNVTKLIMKKLIIILSLLLVQSCELCQAQTQQRSTFYPTPTGTFDLGMRNFEWDSSFIRIGEFHQTKQDTILRTTVNGLPLVINAPLKVDSGGTVRGLATIDYLNVGKPEINGQSFYIMAGFITGANGEKLYVSTSNDGKTWRLIANSSVYTPNFGTIRDPSLLYYNNKYYIAYSTKVWSTYRTFNPNELGFSIISSKDLINWDSVTTVNVFSSGNHHVWAPEWYVETNGDIYLTVGAGDTNLTPLSTRNKRIYWTKALNTSLTSWTTPDSISGTSLPLSMRDQYIVKIGAYYYLWYVDDQDYYVELARSTSLTSGYVVLKSNNWAGWGIKKEGLGLVKMDSTIWRLYFNDYNSTSYYQYTESADTFNTWAGLTNIVSPISPLEHCGILQTRDITNFRNSALAIAVNGGIINGDGNGNAIIKNRTTLDSLMVGDGTNVDPATLATFYSGSTSFKMLHLDFARDNDGSGGLVFTKSRGTTGARTQTLSGDRLTDFTMRGYTNVNTYSGEAVRIRALAAENFSTTGSGGTFTVLTTPIGSTTLLERLRITSSGLFGLNTTIPDSTLTVAGGGHFTGGLKIDNNITAPNIGTMAAMTATNYVPFTGAGSDLNLGTHTIASGAITSSGDMLISKSTADYTHNGFKSINTSATTNAHASYQYKTGVSANVWQTFLRDNIFNVGIESVADLFTLTEAGNATFAGTVQATNIITTTPPTDSTGLARGTVWLKTSDGTLHWKY
jgi:hypothetical protein